MQNLPFPSKQTAGFRDLKPVVVWMGIAGGAPVGGPLCPAIVLSG